MLINNLSSSKPQQRKFSMLPVEQLAPEVQEILNMPRTVEIDADDLNGDKARMEYYQEKYGL